MEHVEDIEEAADGDTEEVADWRRARGISIQDGGCDLYVGTDGRTDGWDETDIYYPHKSCPGFVRGGASTTGIGIGRGRERIHPSLHPLHYSILYPALLIYQSVPFSSGWCTMPYWTVHTCMIVCMCVCMYLCNVFMFVSTVQ